MNIEQQSWRLRSPGLHWRLIIDPKPEKSLLHFLVCFLFFSFVSCSVIAFWFPAFFRSPGSIGGGGTFLSRKWSWTQRERWRWIPLFSDHFSLISIDVLPFSLLSFFYSPPLFRSREFFFYTSVVSVFMQAAWWFGVEEV